MLVSCVYRVDIKGKSSRVLLAFYALILGTLFLTVLSTYVRLKSLISLIIYLRKFDSNAPVTRRQLQSVYIYIQFYGFSLSLNTCIISRRDLYNIICLSAIYILHAFMRYDRERVSAVCVCDFLLIIRALVICVYVYIYIQKRKMQIQVYTCTSLACARSLAP